MSEGAAGGEPRFPLVRPVPYVITNCIPLAKLGHMPPLTEREPGDCSLGAQEEMEIRLVNKELQDFFPEMKVKSPKKGCISVLGLP